MSGRRALPFHRQSADSMPQESRAPSVSESGFCDLPAKAQTKGGLETAGGNDIMQGSLAGTRAG